MGANYTDEEKAWRQLHKTAASNIEAVAVQPPTTHHKNYQN